MALTPLTYPNPPVTGQPTYSWDGTDWLSQFALGKAYVPLDGSQPMTGPLVLPADPTLALQATTKQYTDAGDLALATAFTLPGYLFGLTMSTPGASNTLTVAPGVACNSTGARIMKLAAAMAKTTASWVAGSGAGGLDTGTITASTWTHWYLILNPTTNAVDVVYSTTATPANGPTVMPPGFTLFRRIGSMFVNASLQWQAFSQNGDEFLWAAPFSDVTGVATTVAAQTPALSVPPGVKVTALFNAALSSTDAGPAVLFNAVDQTVLAIGAPAGNYQLAIQTAGSINGGQFQIRTNASQQIRFVSNSASATLYVLTQGWIDRRGRDA
jgi:hypothetical protein